MAAPHSQTPGGIERRAAAQSPLADGQASSRNPDLNNDLLPDDPENSDESAASEKDWGLASARPKGSLAMKAGLVTIPLLLGGFGYAIYHHLQQPAAEVAAADLPPLAPESSATEGETPTVAGDTSAAEDKSASTSKPIPPTPLEDLVESEPEPPRKLPLDDQELANADPFGGPTPKREIPLASATQPAAESTPRPIPDFDSAPAATPLNTATPLGGEELPQGQSEPKTAGVEELLGLEPATESTTPAGNPADSPPQKMPANPLDELGLGEAPTSPRQAPPSNPLPSLEPEPATTPVADKNPFDKNPASEKPAGDSMNTAEVADPFAAPPTAAASPSKSAVPANPAESLEPVADESVPALGLGAAPPAMSAPSGSGAAQVRELLAGDSANDAPTFENKPAVPATGKLEGFEVESASTPPLGAPALGAPAADTAPPAMSAPAPAAPALNPLASSPAIEPPPADLQPQPSLALPASSPASDDRLGGFEVVDGPNASSAVGTTVVTRSPMSDPGQSPTYVNSPTPVADSNRLPPAAINNGFGQPAPARGIPATPPATASGRSGQALHPIPGAPRQNVDLGKDPLTEYFTVGANDNFWKISKQVYGTARYYLALTRFNEGRVPDPQRLRPGTLIATPPRAVLDQRFPESIDRNPVTPAPAAVAPGIRPAAPAFAGPGRMTQPQPRPAPRTAGSAGYFMGPMGQPLYRVGPDDTLTSISQRHLGRASRWTEIFAQNRDRLKTPDRLQQGTVLRLPPDASQLSVMPGPERR